MKMEWDSEINFYFLHFYNYKREHTTNDQILKSVLDNFNNERLERVIITTENQNKNI